MFEEFVFEEETESQDDGKFCEYAVAISLLEWPSTKPVFMSIWAANIEDAMVCGEVLSAVYFA